jgi:hypothetical protein
MIKKESKNEDKEANTLHTSPKVDDNAFLRRCEVKATEGDVNAREHQIERLKMVSA